MRRLVTLCVAATVASCGACGEDDDAADNGGETNNNSEVFEPYVPEQCDSDEDVDGDGLAGCLDPDCRMDAACVFEPPDPVDVAVELPETGIAGFHERMSFLFEGEDAIQRGVDADSIGELTIGAASGMVRDPSGDAVKGAAITVSGKPKFGRTYSRDDGRFDLAYDAGSDLVIRVEKPGYTPVYRTVGTTWHDVAMLDDVVLTPIDSNGTVVDFTETIFVEGSVAEDDDGRRRTAVVVPAGVEASLVMPNGSREPLDEMTVHVTEVTVGDDGPNAMPGRLPGSSQYTFAAEFTVREADARGAAHVAFDAPVYAYVDNFIGFEPGTIVPSGWFDRAEPSWMGSANGVVLRIAEIEDGRAVVEAGEAELEMDDAERQVLAEHYDVGDELWRVPLRHFSSWDFNWPGEYPPGTFPPPFGARTDRSSCGGPTEIGSIIDCNSQTLGERIALNGTPLTFAYQSGRVPGRLPTVTIPLKGGALPPNLQGVDVTMDVAGVHFEESYDADDVPPVQIWTWERHDAFGRFVQGAVPAQIEVTYLFDLSYRVAQVVGVAGLGPAHQALDEDEAGDFAQYTTSDGTTVRIGRGTVAISRRQTVKMGGWDVTKEKLGGWTLAPQHRFDPNVPALHFGSGQDLVAGEDDGTLDVLGGIVRSQLPQAPPDGEQAEGEFLGYIGDVAVGRDGTVYLSGGLEVARIRRIAPDGTIHTVVGFAGLIDEESGDGGPPAEAELKDVDELVVGPDGLLYFESRQGIWKIEDDVLYRLVGGGESHLTDLRRGQRARELDLEGISLSFDVGRDGSIYFASGGNIYRVMPGGRVFDIAGAAGDCPGGGFCDDGSLAADARFQAIESLSVASDGTLVFVEQDRADSTNFALRRIAPDGIVHSYENFEIDGFADLQLHPSSDEIFVAVRDTASLRGVTVAHVLEDGTLEPTVGSVIGEQSAEHLPVLELKDGAAASTPRAAEVIDLAPNGQIVYSDGFQIVRVQDLLPNWTGSEYQIPSGDGGRIYRFHADGRHDLTRDARTGATIWDFDYDDSGRLIHVVDREGDTTQIGRDADGHIDSITGPDGVTWMVDIDDAGYMTSLTSPEDETWTFDYAPGGLLSAMTSPTGHAWSFEYDDKGRLIGDQEATLSREFEDGTQIVTYTSAEGRQTEYGTTLLGDPRDTQRTGNVESSRTARPDGLYEQHLSDGTAILTEAASHPALGYIAAYPAFVGVYTPGGKSLEITRTQTATVEDVDVLSLQSWEEIAESGDRQVTTSWDAASNTLAAETRGGRSIGVVLDDFGRPSQFTGLQRAPYDLTYDDAGRIAEIEQSGRVWSVSYDENGYPSVLQTPDGTVQFARDTMGRTTLGTRSDASTIDFAWDGMSNPVSIAPPERPSYTMEYNERRQPVSFDTPAGSYTFGYNADFQPNELTYPDGRTARVTYDSNGRPTRLTEPDRTIDLAFHDGEPGEYDGTGQLLAAQTDAGVDVELAYDGFLLTDAVWLGEVDGSVSWSYGEQLFLDAISVNGVEVPYEYDVDGVVSKAGEQEITYEDGTFRVARRRLGDVRTDYEYDTFGQLTNERTTANGGLLERSYSYDDLGRITRVVETDQGTEKTLDYSHDALGQLVEVRTDGVVTGAYTYDANGNRTSSLDVASATYDEADAMVTYGSRTYTYSSGQLTSMTDGTTTTNYDYGMFGELRSVTTPTATIEYVHDAFNRRVGKKVDGNLVQGFLYQDALNPVAELAGDGTMRSQFVYATRAHVPDFMIQNGREYAFVTDHLGSVRYVVDTADGSIAQRLEYDEFGQVLTDSNPGFQPFGFAGGLYDGDTGLVRFGLRDYDPAAGRWTATDPLGFGGGQANLWVYVNSSPTNFIDPTGRAAWFMPLVVPALIGGAANIFFHRDQGDRAMAKAFLSGAAGGLLAGAVVIGGPLLGLGRTAVGEASAAVIGTGAGGGLTKAGNLSSCIDEVQDTYWNDVAFTAIVSGFAGLGGAAVASGVNKGFQGFWTKTTLIGTAESASSVISGVTGSHADMWAEGL